MDPIWLVVLIILVAVLGIGIFMMIECSEGFFQKDRRGNSTPSSPYIVGNHFTHFTDEIDVEATYTGSEKSSKPNPIDGLFGHLHRGTQSHHSLGTCNHGGGNWGIPGVSVSGREPLTSNWSPVSGGPFDSCQCGDNGGFH